VPARPSWTHRARHGQGRHPHESHVSVGDIARPARVSSCAGMARAGIPAGTTFIRSTLPQAGMRRRGTGVQPGGRSAHRVLRGTSSPRWRSRTAFPSMRSPLARPQAHHVTVDIYGHLAPRTWHRCWETLRRCASSAAHRPGDGRHRRCTARGENHSAASGARPGGDGRADARQVEGGALVDADVCDAAAGRNGRRGKASRARRQRKVAVLTWCRLSVAPRRGELVEVQADLEGHRALQRAPEDASGCVDAGRFVKFIDVDDGSAAFVLDAPVVRDAGLRVLAELDRAVPVRGLWRNDLDDERYLVRCEPGAVAVVVGRCRQQIRFGRFRSSSFMVISRPNLTSPGACSMRATRAMRSWLNRSDSPRPGARDRRRCTVLAGGHADRVCRRRWLCADLDLSGARFRRWEGCGGRSVSMCSG
jgi:hypothetical protein